MLSFLFEEEKSAVLLGSLLAFAGVFLLLHKCAPLLPRDAGRQYAHNGALSAGKPRGAGFIFVLVFAATVLLFIPFSVEYMLYLILIIAAMMTGYLDDGSKKPWGEYKKGLLDLLIAVLTAVTFLNFNPSLLKLCILNRTVILPVWLFGLLMVVLVWGSINVTNCADGVDGLSGTLTLLTLMTFCGVMLAENSRFRYVVLLFCACVLAYQWFNASPSKLLMGDAGSRAMGLMIAIAAVKSGAPLLYFLAALVLLADGGAGLVKVSLLRFLKIRILKNVRTPLHDHVRKNKGWSDTQTVFRFSILQILFSALALYFALI